MKKKEAKISSCFRLPVSVKEKLDAMTDNKEKGHTKTLIRCINEQYERERKAGKLEASAQ